MCEGKKREIRRMARVLGYHVRRLRRISFGTMKIESLEVGESRALSETEVKELKKITGM